MALSVSQATGPPATALQSTAPPGTAAAAPTSVEPAREPAAVNAGLLGLNEADTDDFKQAAVSLMQGQGRAKRPKLTHSLFFQDDKGLQKIVKTFPKIRFQGKGREFDDLKLLIRHYEKWFKELFPCDDNFEDLVWKARTVLQEKEKSDDGIVSDPREQLHRMRYEYKLVGGTGTRAEHEARLLQRAAAASAKKQGTAAADKLSEELRERMKGTRQLDVETLWKIEEKRAKALELRKKRQAELAAAAGEPPLSQSSRGASQEDVFGFGGGLDGSQESRGASQHVTTAAAPKAAGAPPAPQVPSEEDAFDLAFAADAMAGSQASQGSRGRRGLSQHSQEEDVFGFGFGMDSQSQGSAPSQPVAPVEQEEPPQRVLSDELQRKIAANRQRALEVQQRRREQERVAGGEAPDEPNPDMDIGTMLKIEENRAKAMELRKKKQAQRAAREGSQSTQPSQNSLASQDAPMDVGEESGLGFEAPAATAAMPPPAALAAVREAPEAARGVEPADESDFLGFTQPDVFDFGPGLDASQAEPAWGRADVPMEEPEPALPAASMPPPALPPTSALQGLPSTEVEPGSTGLDATMEAAPASPPLPAPASPPPGDGRPGTQEHAAEAFA